MKEYDIRIQETLVKTVTVEAESAAKAREIAERQWKDGDYILDADDFQGVHFSCLTPKDRER